jgi:hypothetical protein
VLRTGSVVRRDLPIRSGRTTSIERAGPSVGKSTWSASTTKQTRRLGPPSVGLGMRRQFSLTRNAADYRAKTVSRCADGPRRQRVLWLLELFRDDPDTEGFFSQSNGQSQKRWRSLLPTPILEVRSWAQRHADQHGFSVVSERRHALSSTDFAALIDSLKAHQSRHIVSLLVFERPGWPPARPRGDRTANRGCQRVSFCA